MTDFLLKRQEILCQIEAACQKNARNATELRLLAVSKTQPASLVRQLYAMGQCAFGENYLQEALAKQAQLQDLPIEWHFIGHVQRNKTRPLALHFDWVQGVDRLIVAQRLSSQRPENLPDLNLCIQVNVDGQDSKAGCAPDAAAALVAQISPLERICLRGLMVIPKAGNSKALTDAKTLFDELARHHAQPEHWDTLSMGMSGDLEQAIAAGSTMLRVGTALFGARD